MTAGSSGIVAAARVTRSTMLSTPQGQRRPGKVLGNQALPLAMENYYEYPFEQRVSPSAESALRSSYPRTSASNPDGPFRAQRLGRTIAELLAISCVLDTQLPYRNKEPLLQEIRELVDGWEHLEQVTVLEVASGTGQHVAFFAEALPKVHWTPTEVAGDLLGSIHAWTSDMQNVDRPVCLDVGSDWKMDRQFQMVLTCNLTHIAPWSATIGLFTGAAKLLLPGGVLFIYGPFLKNGAETTQSNAQFNSNLKARNPEWGYRDIEDLNKVGTGLGLKLYKTIDMPANNFTLLFKKE